MQESWRSVSKQNKEIRRCFVMCSVGDSFGVELESGMEPHEYECNHYGKTFKG